MLAVIFVIGSTIQDGSLPPVWFCNPFSYYLDGEVYSMSQCYQIELNKNSKTNFVYNRKKFNISVLIIIIYN